MILIDPVTRQPLGPLPGDPPRKPSVAAHWLIERDESGVPVRMRWNPCGPDCWKGCMK